MKLTKWTVHFLHTDDFDGIRWYIYKMENNENERSGLPDSIRRIIVKVGSRILVDEKGRPDPRRIGQLAAQVADLHKRGLEVILVSSGAIAAGVESLGWTVRPTHLADLQMAAAVGQGVLIHRYSEEFASHGCRIGQVLLTHADLRDRERHLNARNTILAMLRNGVIPIVNENDVVAVDEIRFGDNDLLASMVAALVHADLLMLLTTADGFFKTRNGELIERISRLEAITDDVLKMAGGKGSDWSTGGMDSKLRSARNALKAGTPVMIVNGATDGVLREALAGKDVGTLIRAEVRNAPLRARKKWIAFFHRPQGTLVVDEGAHAAICNQGVSLLPVGVSGVRGSFGVGATVNVETVGGEVFARGITAYSSRDIESIKGRHSREIGEILGHSHHPEIIHRDNLVILEESV
ncbi:MAG: glutamate 5-kinase [Balneolaceae bacterium]